MTIKSLGRLPSQHKSISRSRPSVEVEYQAMILTSFELIWRKHHLQELCFCKKQAISQICANQEILHIGPNLVFNSKLSLLRLIVILIMRR